ncbi:hypothetical protein BUALT_Bualt12G0008300 [Buddleja alternifolia]|uniref:Reverse transcriptase domain-containing protein n=1 Tax=Buddleja alternifolia TaxID=168488 RepID=A0AAV6WP56_9LAMI|nr:hypothetical protein BUALT_Bualt12G0008300 [Buddleja alternifolia]
MFRILHHVSVQNFVQNISVDVGILALLEIFLRVSVQNSVDVDILALLEIFLIIPMENQRNAGARSYHPTNTEPEPFSYLTLPIEDSPFNPCGDNIIPMENQLNADACPYHPINTEPESFSYFTLPIEDSPFNPRGDKFAHGESELRQVTLTAVMPNQASDESFICFGMENDSEVSSSVGSKSDRKILKTFEKFSENGKEKAKCRKCGQIYASGPCGTTNMKRHIRDSCPFRDQSGVEFQNIEFDQSIFRKKVAKAMIKHNYPFKFVEHEGIRDVFSYLNPRVQHVSRNTAKGYVLKIYEMEKEKITGILASTSSRICLTSDMWSSLVSNGYMAVTAHYVDNNWLLQKKVLVFRHLPPPHGGQNVGERLISFLQEWGIERKFFTITLDNAKYNDGVVDLLRNHLSLTNSLLCDGDFLHVRCGAHILNLVVQAGLKTIDTSIGKIRDSMKYVRGSEARMIRFAECVQQLGLKTSKKLKQDMPIRWNSTYLMLDSAILYLRAFFQLKFVDSNYKWCPSLKEWSRVRKITKFLRPFHDMTEIFSGNQYPTANLYFRNVWDIEMLIQEEMESTDIGISVLSQRGLVKYVAKMMNRSKKKVKTKSLDDSDTLMEEDSSACNPTDSHMKTKISYLESLKRQTATQAPQRLIPFDEESMVNLEYISVLPAPADSPMLRLKLDEGYAKAIRRAWTEALILKVEGRMINFNLLTSKIDTLWSLNGDFELAYLGHSRYILRVKDKDKADHILTEGPWRIFSSYINVGKWFEGFRASTYKVTTAVTWVRIPELAIVLYQPEILFTIAKGIGKPVKMDHNTYKSARGRFARFCVQVELSKPLLLAVEINDIRYLITYENLPSICFSCGRVGHKNTSYPAPAKSQQPSQDHSSSEMETGDGPAVRGKDKQEEMYGAWLQVEKSSYRCGGHQNKAKGMLKEKRKNSNPFNALVVEEGTTLEYVAPFDGNDTHVAPQNKVKGPNLLSPPFIVPDLLSKAFVPFEPQAPSSLPSSSGGRNNDKRYTESGAGEPRMQDYGEIKLGRIVLDALHALPKEMRIWNKKTFGHVFSKKRELLARILGAQKRLTDAFLKVFVRSHLSMLFGGDDTAFLDMGLNSPYQRHLDDNTVRSLVSSISEIEHPESITQFRPIALCNVLFKIVTKTVVLRLKPFMDKLISPHQSSFILGRSTHDNILVLQELAHTLAASHSKKGSMLIKLDLEKEYDKVRWDFLTQTLQAFHFPEKLVNLIMSCVESAHLQILWNGEPLEPFAPRCGLRQGDPLSPYLFVLCMERLSYLIEEEVNNKVWDPISFGRNSPCISHMFFANDIILAAKANEKSARSIQKTLDLFCKASGLKVSLAKSTVYFAPRTAPSVRGDMVEILNFQPTSHLGKYLGVNINHSRNSSSNFRGLIEKVQLKLSGWKAKNLNLAARTTLIQSVTSAFLHILCIRIGSRPTFVTN